MKIVVEGIKLRAFHGCLPEEARIGGNYIVDVSIETDFSKAAQSDDLSQTVDYCIVYEIVKKEMAVRSNLIEHVAKRIIQQLKNQFPEVISCEVKVVKLNPPMNGDVEQVSVIIKE